MTSIEVIRLNSKMPRITNKYLTACVLADKLGVNCDQKEIESLYNILESLSYSWDVSEQEWQLNSKQAAIQSTLVRVELSTDLSEIEALSSQIKNKLKEIGLNCFAQSKILDVADISEQESRVYISFG